MQFEEWIEQAYSLGASDLHLEADTPIVARIRGDLQTLGGVVPGATLMQVARELLGAERWPDFVESMCVEGMGLSIKRRENT